MPYAVKIANGLDSALQNSTIKTGVNIYRGSLTEKAVAESLQMPYIDLDSLLEAVEV